MNKSDKVFIAIVLLFSIMIYFFSDYIFKAITSDNLQAVVYVNDAEYGRFPMTENQEVVIPGALGDVVVEIKNNKVRIQTETSPLHICSLQGWVDRAYVSLICLPNNVIVQIENATQGATEPEVDSVTQ